MNIDSNDCNKLSFNACEIEEKEALIDSNLDKSAELDFESFSETTHSLRNLILELLKQKKEVHANSKDKSGEKKENDNIFNDFKLKGLSA